jgi:hypothetical protein
MRKALLALAAVAATTLAAQSASVNGGLQVGLNLPTGDFADKKASDGTFLGANEGVGLHFGGHLDFNLSRHHQVRLIAESNGFASKEQHTYGGTYYYDTRQNTFGVAQFGADYVFNVESPSRGGYFLVGLNLNQVKATAKYSNAPDIDLTQSGRGGFRIGGGYTFNRIFSLEAHLNSVSVDKNGPDGLGYDAITWLAVSAVFRFGR